MWRNFFDVTESSAVDRKYLIQTVSLRNKIPVYLGILRGQISDELEFPKTKMYQSIPAVNIPQGFAHSFCPVSRGLTEV